MFYEPSNTSRFAEWRARRWAPLILALAALGAVGLSLTNSNTVRDPASFAAASSAWTALTAQTATASPRVAERPLAGDEGFWLSRNDLAGSTASGVKLGDRISIASPVETEGTKTRNFEIVELKPLHDVQTGLSPTSSATPPVALTMVVAREIDAGTSTPGVLRFLIEGAAGIALPATSARTL